MNEYSGWLFDLYTHPEKGIVLWLIGENRRPYRFHQDFEITFYAGGPHTQLHDLGGFLWSKYPKNLVKLTRTTKEDLFAGPHELMGIRVLDHAVYKQVFRDASRKFPGLIYSNVDVPLTLRYAAAYNVFMMARCKVIAQPDGKLVGISALDTNRDLNPILPELKILHLEPDTDPSQKKPRHLILKYNDVYIRAPFSRPKELLNLLNNIFSTFDPDVIQTHFGDTMLFPYLKQISKETGISFNPNRDISLQPVTVKETSFFNYGRAHYRGPQLHLRGRWHVDVENCMTYGQYRLIGAIEQVRLSSLPLQGVARRSPGASIAAMQDLTAMRRNVLIPYQRQKGEIPKTYNELVESDRGGLVLRPQLGIHGNVAVLDFASLMASIIIKWNVSPETVVSIVTEEHGFEIPELGIKILARPGLVPETLRDMRDKRITLKRWLKNMAKDDPLFREAHRRYKPIVDGLKWLTVVCYGRLGFANATFGRVNAHEVVSFLSRQVITQAMAIAEAQGYTVLHLYVDSIFVARADAKVEEFQALAEQIERETELPMDLENVYSWFAFPGSRESPNLSVSNRFFGRASDGKHKIRGLALRRGDTPLFVSEIQRGVFKILAKEANPEKLADLLPEVLKFVQEKLTSLTNREVPIKRLIVTQILSRELDQYSALSSLVVAARQLQANGKTVKMGQQIRFIYVSRGPAIASDLAAEIDPRMIDVTRYKELILRAVHDLLQPLGITEKTLRDWLFSKAGYITQPGTLGSSDQTRSALPLFNTIKRLHVDSL